jgi:hypothetical protein
MIIGMIDKAQGRDSPNNPFRLKRSSLSGSKKEEFRTVLSLLIPKRFTKSAFKPKRRSWHRGLSAFLTAAD